MGRAAESARIAAFLDGLPGSGTSRAMLLSGEAGIGKTVLWWWAIGEARRRGYITLVARPAEPGGLAYEGIAELLSERLSDELHIPGNLRRTLEAALLLTDHRPGDATAKIDRRAVALACLAAFRALTVDAPVLVAIDDLPLLDAESRRVVEILPRRLGHEGLGLILTARNDPPGVGGGLALDESLGSIESLDVLSVGSLSDEQLILVVSARRGGPLPRPVMRRILQIARGNPMLAVEIARSLDEGGTSIALDGMVGVPAALRHLVATRLARLSTPVCEAVQVISLATPPTTRVVEHVLGPGWEEGVDGAIDLGIVETRYGRLSIAHPLIASCVREDTPHVRRREIHARLAALAIGIEDRALHEGLAATKPDADVSELLAEASRAAWSRGAVDAAASFAEHAVRLTPADAPERPRRIIAAADLLFEAGDVRRSVAVAESALDPAADTDGPRWESPPAGEDLSGYDRAALLLRLARGTGVMGGHRASVELLRQALSHLTDQNGAAAEADLVALRARIQAELAVALGQYDVSAARLAWQDASESVAASGDPGLAADLAGHLADLLVLSADPTSADIVARDLAPAAPGVDRQGHHEPVPRVLRSGVGAAMRLKTAGHLNPARLVLVKLREQIEQEGGEGSLPPVLFHLAELECFAGRLPQAIEAVQGCRTIVARSDQRGLAPQLDYIDALIAGYGGDFERATRADSGPDRNVRFHRSLDTEPEQTGPFGWVLVQ